ncbi:MAG: DUF357 domain-containing protein [Candidatus Aenigmatarchaeota archaeon]|nr:DUF357 domain-containing protein [Nanoarchaeota archaeon]
MDETEESLKHETNKWLYKLEREIPLIFLTGSFDKQLTEDSITNIKAYLSDCKYFQEQSDWIRAFESIVYAWGIYETLVRLNAIDIKDETQPTTMIRQPSVQQPISQLPPGQPPRKGPDAAGV